MKEKLPEKIRAWGLPQNTKKQKATTFSTLTEGEAEDIRLDFMSFLMKEERLQDSLNNVEPCKKMITKYVQVYASHLLS